MDAPKNPKISSEMLKLKTKTIFFDVYQAKNNSQYLKITESRFNKDTKQSTRSSILLFCEDLDLFKEKINAVTLK